MKKFLLAATTVLTALSLTACDNPLTALTGGTTTATEGESTSSPWSMLIYLGVIVVFFVAMYFLAIRPQKKQEKEQKAMLASMAVGDTVLTTAGFYGVVIDITNDTVIVEFGNNKNCRIPMQKSSIIQLEHPEGYAEATKEETTEKSDK